MARLRLRTQLLLATAVLITAVMGATLLLVRQTVKQEVSSQVDAGIASSVRAFQNMQRQRQVQLSRTAALLSILPPLKAVMTTDHPLTIQDSSLPFWHLAGSDLFALGNPDGHLLAFHMKDESWARSTADHMMVESVRANESAAWWYSDGHLYWVFLRPMTLGAGEEQHQLGWIAIGYQVDNTVAEELASVAGSQIVLAADNHIIASTIGLSEPAFRQVLDSHPLILNHATEEVTIAGQQFQAASVMLDAATPTPVRCIVLLPLRQSTIFVTHLNRTLGLLGAAAVLFGALIFSFISRAITRPLENLVAGVRALASGDYTYSINSKGSREVEHLGNAFGTMRTRLLDSQQRQIEAERLAALGRTASSISHDLRHYLAALVANAEFLYEAESLRLDREEIYREIKLASDQMTDLIDSLRELSREHGTISPKPGEMNAVMHRAVDAVASRSEYRSCQIEVNARGDMEGTFDSRKLERAFFNLLLNACESRADGKAKITIEIDSHEKAFSISIRDNGEGIPENIRPSIFEPFVSSGKPNGTGLGLAIVSKIVRDHGGTVEVEESTSQGTVMQVVLPRMAQVKEAKQAVASER
ncbi:MAG TPA: HAMP domain-containing sensor histidine kinase [Terriglobales bacterium]|nr:HAMP domain-containing sensor histidine kinase [Terriglobales bacterium]